MPLWRRVKGGRAPCSAPSLPRHLSLPLPPPACGRLAVVLLCSRPEPGCSSRRSRTDASGLKEQ
eukprot:6872533-Alexandrium_andersonii.AAC.1